ncbi:hypothetical protein [Alteromonas sp. AMM-1]|uniref:hypothetical protein n=1 Tax=Alteromonas sp. AMM-1 TaxID=3394233 RepID=UPI0039A5893B
MQNKWVKELSATFFAGLFMLISATMIGLAGVHFIEGFNADIDFVSAVIKSINDLFIALATYELAIGIYKEYRFSEEDDLFDAIRRTVTRFVSVVIIALVLEGLIMIIKYSQLDLAGNLFYPVAVVVAASLLLMALGLFLRWSRASGA